MPTRVRPERVDRAAVARAEEATVLRAKEHEYPRPVARSRVWPLSKLRTRSIVEACEIFVVELDAVVTTARCAGEAVERERAGRPGKAGVALAPPANDVGAVRWNTDEREPKERAFGRHAIACAPEIEERPEPEVERIGSVRAGDDEARAGRGLPDDRVTAGANVGGRLSNETALERSNNGADDTHGCHGTRPEGTLAGPMRAIVITRYGGPEVLELRDVTDPAPARGEVLVRVYATAVNRADLLQRMGHYPAPDDAPADIPGLEFAGEIEALGAGVSGLSVGARVFGLVGGGSYAQRVVVPASAVASIPNGLSFVEAASIPEAFVTAYDAMVVRAGLAPGDTVLVHAAASGVGTAAVQLAHALGARAIGTARSDEKLARAWELGLAAGIVANEGRFAKAVLDDTPGGVDVVVELVGGAYLAEDLACVAPCGHIAMIGLMAGARAEIDLGALLRKRITLFGTVLRSRPIEEKIAAGQLLARRIAPLFAERRVRPVVDCVMPLEDAAAAHVYLASNQSFGKVVLSVS